MQLAKNLDTVQSRYSRVKVIGGATALASGDFYSLFYKTGSLA